MKLSKRKRTDIPGIIIILIIIFFAGLGLKGGRYIINQYTGKKQPKANENLLSVENIISKTSLSSSKYRKISQLSDCQVVIQNSLFDQLGGRKIERQVVEAPKKIEVKTDIPQTRPEPLNYLLLTGIVYLNGEPLALIEDSSKGKSYFLKKGDKIRDYTVEEITGKEVILLSENSRIVQSLGSKAYYNTDRNLLVSGSVASDSSNNPQVKPVNESVLSDNKDSSLSLIEQMRVRRKKELGQE